MGGRCVYIGASSGPAWEMARAPSRFSERRGWGAILSRCRITTTWLYREEGARHESALRARRCRASWPWSPLARAACSRAPRVRDGQSLKTQGTDRAEARHILGAALRQIRATGMSLMRSRKVAKAARCLDVGGSRSAGCCSGPVVAAPIVGATKMEHLETALKAVSVKLTQEEITALESPYTPHGVRGFICGRERARRRCIPRRWSRFQNGSSAAESMLIVLRARPSRISLGHEQSRGRTVHQSVSAESGADETVPRRAEACRVWAGRRGVTS